MPSVRDPAYLHRLNRGLVLDYLRQKGPAGRAGLARELGMSLPTVVRIIEEFEAERLVRGKGAGPSTGGRPSPLFVFSPEAHCVVSVDVGGSKMHGVMTDLAGEVLNDICFASEGVEGRAAADRLFDLIAGLIAAPGRADRKILGIGVGVPSVVTHPEGGIVWAPSLSWRDLPLKDLLLQRFRLPVVVENDVNLAALGELYNGAGRGARNLILIAAGTGLGAGIVIDGALYRGSHQAAGEVGCMLPGTQFLKRRYDRFGALESLASAAGMASQARRSLRRRGLPIPEDLDAHQVCEAARAGEAWARDLLAETADYLSLTLINLAMILDPEVIVFTGGLSLSADLFLPILTEKLNAMTTFPPRLTLGALGGLACAMGAVSLVLDVASGRAETL